MLWKKKPVLNDQWFRFLGIPAIALMSHIIFYNRNHSGEERFGFWTIYLLSLVETYVVWEAIRIVIIYFRKRYPAISESKKRITGILLLGTLAVIIIRTANIYIYDKTQLWGYPFPLEGYLYSIFVALLYLIIVGGAYEAIYYFHMWKYAAWETEALRNENLQTQLDSLKSQINPHFLFNSLSSLASLISEDQHKAEEFVNELSSVYRYLLQANDSELTTVEKELKFIEAYARLMTIRFGEAFAIIVNVESKFLQYKLPPLTLQLLVENAVKHNIILPQKPLRINISTNGNENIIVENNLQKKNNKETSGKLGLRNISSKYRLLKQKDIVVQESAESFRVIIHLIKYGICV